MARRACLDNGFHLLTEDHRKYTPIQPARVESHAAALISTPKSVNSRCFATDKSDVPGSRGLAAVREG
jgi:hypothetical protein